MGLFGLSRFNPVQYSTRAVCADLDTPFYLNLGFIVILAISLNIFDNVFHQLGHSIKNFPLRLTDLWDIATPATGFCTLLLSYCFQFALTTRIFTFVIIYNHFWFSFQYKCIELSRDLPLFLIHIPNPGILIITFILLVIKYFYYFRIFFSAPLGGL